MCFAGTSFSFRSAPCSRDRPALAHVSCPPREPSGAAARPSGCSTSGERLVSAARDGDAIEAQMLLELSPALARYSTFGGLNTPLHFAAAKGHLEDTSRGHMLRDDAWRRWRRYPVILNMISEFSITTRAYAMISFNRNNQLSF